MSKLQATKRHAFMIGTVLALSTMSFSQAVLPKELEAGAFGFDGPFAAKFRLVQTDPKDSARAYVIFSNSPDSEQAADNRISIEWEAKKLSNGGDGQWKTSTQEFPTYYKPTAVCAAAPTTRTMYVAGWIETTGEAIIEKWELSQGTDVSGQGFVQPSVSKSILFQSNTLQPLSSITRNPYSNKLWVMEWPLVIPKRVMAIDLRASPSDEVLQLIYDDSLPAHRAQFPGVTNYRTMRSGTHPSAGWIIYFERRPYWEGPNQFESPYPLFVCMDVDKDGVIDTLSSSTYNELFNAYPYGEWDESFSH